MTYIETSREFRISVFEIAATAADRFAQMLRRVAELETRRTAITSSSGVDASERRSQAPPAEAPGRLASEAVRMQRLL
jgi:hypothetical protein